ncbi:hypothetical protein NTE_00247 [Candidatus Nitrososphaera evergladensis SR1]|uniref:Uncharacterized protein n=1 Tax=Candidatus Nitrososphaera evergladensis SR1 TaxID=1459636 RepID=A0A075MSK6_9ARCH|nr:hypothetical protein [Candidatus Nitrososphaera evergladensis]AIF82329.1 hypothetical protein NTE_00247 [Candidatus Nitrososphaera evergladensis SR1]
MAVTEQINEEKLLADVSRYAKAYEASGEDPLSALTEALKLEMMKICQEELAKLDAEAQP